MIINDLQLHPIDRGFFVDLVLDNQSLDYSVRSVFQVHDN